MPDNQPKKSPPRFSPEVRERAVRMVLEHEGEYASRWEAVRSIAPKFGCSGHALLEWVKKAEVDSGSRNSAIGRDVGSDGPSKGPGYGLSALYF